MRSGQHTMIKSTFWSDDDIQRLDKDQTLAVLWLLTNDDLDHAGVTTVRKVRFESESKVALESLWQAIEALPRAFKRFGNQVWAVNFIRHQWPERSLASNNCAKAICRCLLDLRDPVLYGAILDEYPVLKDVMQEYLMGRGSKPSQGVPNPQSRAVQCRSVQGGGGRGVGKGIPHDDEVLAWAAKWPGELNLAGPIPEDVVASCLARWNASSYGWPPSWQRALVSSYREAMVVEGRKNGAKNPGLTNFSRAKSIRDRLEEIERLENSMTATPGQTLDDETASERRQLQRELADIEQPA